MTRPRTVPDLFIHILFFAGTLIALGWTALSVLSQIENLNTLRIQGEGAVAVVTATKCEDHGLIQYIYSVKGHTVNSQSSDCTVQCNSLQIGDKINIEFNPAQISLNACGKLEQKLNTAILSGYFVLFGFAFVMVLYILNWFDVPISIWKAHPDILP